MNKLLPPPGRLLIPVLACCLPLTVAVAAPVAASTYKVFVPKHRAHPAAPITGRVTDEKGEGLPGVTVRVKNGNQGTTTDVNGNFSLDAPADATLIISSVGYTTKEIAVNNQTTINTSLAADTQQLGWY
jgi:uncharacterized membrane protein